MSKENIISVILAIILGLFVAFFAETHKTPPTKITTENEPITTTPAVTTKVEAETLDTTTAPPTYRIRLADDELELMVRVVMSEASREPYEGKVAVAEVIINRVLSSKYADNVTDVIHQTDQFSTQDNGAPTEECYEAVYEALTSQKYPSNMYYFRGGHYHDWATDYMVIGKHYFSLGD